METHVSSFVLISHLKPVLNVRVDGADKWCDLDLEMKCACVNINLTVHLPEVVKALSICIYELWSSSNIL